MHKFSDLDNKPSDSIMPSFFASPPPPPAESQSNKKLRRQFSFMKYSPDRRSAGSMRRTREHAKQIALQLADHAHAEEEEEEAFSSAFEADFDANFNAFSNHSTATTEDATTSSSAISQNGSSSAYNMGVIDSYGSNHPTKKKSSLDLFVEQHAATRRSGLASLKSVTSPEEPQQRTDRTVNSMPTFPSNSTLQSKNATPPPSGSHNSAAARRRLRKMQSSGGGSSVGSSSSVHEYETLDPPAAALNPTSPVQYTLRDNSHHSGGSQRSSASSTRRQFRTPSPSPGPSTPVSERSSSSNLFVDDDDHNGFTFDAFGLDEQQVSQEVTAALQDLAGMHPELVFGELGDDEFPEVNFEHSPAGSRTQSRGSSPCSDGDGFTLTKPSGLPELIRPSPPGSDRSSLTSTSNADNSGERVNMFKVQAGFHTSQRSRPPRQESSNWATFGRPPTSPPFKSEARSSPSLRTAPAPVLPHLEPPSPATVEDNVWHEPVKSDAGAPSDVGVASDIGVASDGGVNSDVGGSDVPREVTSSLRKKKPKDTLKWRGDDRPPSKSPVNELKDHWEKRELTESEKKAQRLQERQRARSPLDQGQIHRLQAQLGDEILTPETVGRKWPLADSPVLTAEASPEQGKREKECQEQRTSFASYRERLKPTLQDARISSSSKSDFVSNRSSPSAELQSILSRVKRNNAYAPSPDECAKSDVGDSRPAFASVRLRSTGERSPSISPFANFDDGSKMYQRGVDAPSSSHGERSNSISPFANFGEEPTMYRSQVEEDDQDPREDVRVVAPVPKKMTYKEKRELELKRQRAEQERKEAEERANKQPERDVASLIRRRIAANKKNAQRGDNGNSSQGEEVAFARDKLKKVSLDENISPSIDRSRSVESPLHSVGGAFSSKNEIRTRPPEWSGSNDSLPPMISSEVDSSSTVRSTVETHSPNSQHQFGNQFGNIETPPPQAVPTESTRPAPAKSTKSMLNAFFATRLSGGAASPDAEEEEDDKAALTKARKQQFSEQNEATELAGPTATQTETAASDGRPALKDDPKYDRYFRMLKVGMPIEVVKHAMTQDGVDPAVLDGDHSKPAGCGGVPLKDDPKYTKYFKMLKMGLPMGAVQNAMERDGLDPSVMDGDHNLPAGAGKSNEEDDISVANKPKDTHRRTRLHWDTLRKVKRNSLWAKIDSDPELDMIDIDEEEFAELFQAELTPSQMGKKSESAIKKRGAAVRVIEAKRANNGGIILARLKMTHDDMADAVDRIDGRGMTSEQMQNIIEFLPTSDERKALEAYMLEGGQDAAEKFDGLCECEKFMVSMMTVKHAKRKVRALLFKLQFESFLSSLNTDAVTVENACDEVSNSARLRRLLGIILNIGNRLNTAGVSGKRKAGAFTLSSLLKLSHAKAFDKKTTFLDYVILVVQRKNEILLRFKDDIPTALKADKVYWDQCLNDLEEVENQLENVRLIALHQARLAQAYRLRKKKPRGNGDEDGDSISDVSMSLEEEVEALRATQIGLFTLGAIKKVSYLREKVEMTKKKFGRLLEYFGEEDSKEMQPHELFNTIATFSRDFDKAKAHVFSTQKEKVCTRRVTNTP